MYLFDFKVGSVKHAGYTSQIIEMNKIKSVIGSEYYFLLIAQF